MALLAGHWLSGGNSSQGLGKAKVPRQGRAAWRVFGLCIPRLLLALPVGSRHGIVVQASPSCPVGLDGSPGGPPPPPWLTLLPW